jgi:uncharacterized protein involved in exopolysaccharide biosynthesis
LEKQYPDEIDILDIFNILWSKKHIISSVSFVAAIITFVVCLILPNEYRAEVLLAPVSDGGGPALGKFGGLASLAGIQLGGDGVSKAQLTLQILKSRLFIAEFVRKHSIDIPLMAGKAWTYGDGWEIDEDI